MYCCTPQHLLHHRLHQRHAGHVGRSGDKSVPQHGLDLRSQGRLDVGVAGQLVQGPGQSAGDLRQRKRRVDMIRQLVQGPG